MMEIEQQVTSPPAQEIIETEPTLEEAKAEAERLFQLLDDIDTVNDWARSNDSAYRAAVDRLQCKRWKGRITTDGYKLFWKKPTS